MPSPCSEPVVGRQKEILNAKPSIMMHALPFVVHHFSYVCSMLTSHGVLLDLCDPIAAYDRIDM